MQRQAFLRMAIVIAVLIGFGSLGNTQGLEDAVHNEIDSLIDVYKHLHSHPELSYHEKETAAYLAQYLRELGFEVTEGVGRYPDPARIIVALQTIVSREVSPLDSAVVTVGSIHGGSKHNIIPDQVHLQLTVRSYKPEVRKRVLESIRRIADGVAASAGIPQDLAPIVEIDESEYTPTTYNDPELTARLVATFERVLGPKHVIETDPVMGGEDFSRYTLEDRAIPISMFWLGTIPRAAVREAQRTRTPLPSLHSSQFAPAPSLTLATGVTAMTAAVLELMGGKD